MKSAICSTKARKAASFERMVIFCSREQPPDMILSANIGCITHLQSGTGTPVRHWVEVLDEALAPAHRSAA